MRLIDGDALKEEIEFHPTSVSVCATVEQARGETNFKLRCLEDIDNAPTIDAIPVEWIEDRLAKMLKGKACGFVECATIQALLVSWENHKIHLQAKIEREAR